jgi:CRP-like cAMP-binding protein
VENLAVGLSRAALFSGLAREDLARIAAKIEEKKFSVGEIIVKQGEAGDALYVVHTGAVEVVLEQGGSRAESLTTLGPSECF